MKPVTDAAEGCAREPIHLSGAIQAHGYLIACALPDWTIRHVSQNIEALLEAPLDELLGHSLREYASEDVLQSILDTVALLAPNSPAQRSGQVNLGPLGTACELVVHVAEDLVHIEIEPRFDRGVSPQPTTLAQSMIAAVASGGAEDFHSFVADQVRQLTGYDRVMVYRFRHDGAGEVIAESHDQGMEPYLGLRYPATDIPVQARALYLRNRLRVIPDTEYVPVPIVPAMHADGRVLDLSQHALRSVSPVHVEYLRNMGVAASMSISIVVGGRLWGLIACHHRQARRVPPVIRAAADLFGLFVSMRVASGEHQDTMAHFEHAQALLDALARRMADASDFDEALAAELPFLRVAMKADSAALWADSRFQMHGQVPGGARLAALVEWLQAQGAASVVHSNEAIEWAPTAAGDPVAGVLALRLSSRDWLLLFRNEQVDEVRWAGEPRKAVIATDDGLRIAPRRSFGEWRERVRGHCAPWTEADMRGAVRLHALLGELRRSMQMRGGNAAFELAERRLAMADRRTRLDELAELLDGLSHLDPARSAQLDAHISALEQELRHLAQGPATRVA